MPSIARALAVLAILTITGALHAQALPGPPVHGLRAVVATATIPFGNITQLRALSDGRVLVNDNSRRLVWLLDAGLGAPRIVLDSAAGHPNSYGGDAMIEGASLLRGAADSSLFLDVSSGSLVVLDASGTPVRAMPLPPATASAGAPVVTGTGGVGPATGTVVGRATAVTGGSGPGLLARSQSPSMMLAFIAGIGGTPAISARFGLVYPSAAAIAPSVPAHGPADTVAVTIDDSAAVLAMNVATRMIDTVAKFATGATTVYTFVGVRPAPSRVSVPRLFGVADAWVVMSDGAVAVLHSREYRLSWINPDGTRTESARLPYPWQRLTDVDKTRIADSANAVAETAYNDRLAKRAADSAANRGAAGRGAIVARGSSVASPPKRIEPSALPEYLPPTVSGRDMMLADGDNNVWIHVSLPGMGSRVYDVVNRKGELIDRVQLAEGQDLVGVGKGGLAYVVTHDAGKELLSAVRWR